jgi:hypothetical protein
MRIILHLPAIDDLGGMMVFKRERVGATGAFVGNRFEFGDAF